MRKLVTVLVIAMFLVSMVPVGQPAIADEQQMGLLRYSYTDGITATLSISGSTASCSGKVTPASSSYKASITVTLYRSTDGSTWSKVDSWSGTTSASGTKTLTSGYSYKVVSSATIKDANGNPLETVSATSAVKSY